MDEKKIEQKIDEISSRVDEKLNDIGDRLDEVFDGKKKSESHRRGGEFAGILLIVIGFIFLAQNLDWFDWDLPWFPLLLIVIGVYLIYNHREKH